MTHKYNLNHLYKQRQVQKIRKNYSRQRSIVKFAHTNCTQILILIKKAQKKQSEFIRIEEDSDC